MTTPNLGLSEVPSNSLQPSVPINASLQVLDALVIPGGIVQAITATPPTTVSGDVGKLWIVDVAATAAWTLHDGDLALCTAAGVWVFYTAGEGWLAHNLDGGDNYRCDGAGIWTLEAGGGGGGMTNPMTTAGDVIVGGVAGAPARLGAGTDTHVLTMVAGAPAWAAPAGGSSAASIAVQYVAETGSTADSDPGAGLLKWNNSTQASATFLYLDDDTDDAVSMTGFWAALDAGGFVYLQHATVQDTWQIWEATAITDAAGYAKLAVALVANGGAFADGDPMLVTIEQGSAGAGALANFTDGLNTTSPNGSVPVCSLSATNAATDVDAALNPKGSGALLAQVPDGTTAGGNKRSIYATDFQRSRTGAAQVASGFRSTISGGRNNTASGGDSTVSGGRGNNASGGDSVIGGGNGNTANDTAATVAGGDGNTAGNNATVGGGTSNTASGVYGVVGGGYGNIADAEGSCIPGGIQATARGIFGAWARASNFFTAKGDAQSRCFVLRRSTANATQATVSTDNSAAGASNQIVLPNTSSFVIRGTINARENATGDAASWDFVAHIKRGANAAATAMVAACAPTVIAADAGASTWVVSVDADTTLGCLRVRVTGEASHTIRWVTDVYSCNEVVG